MTIVYDDFPGIPFTFKATLFFDSAEAYISGFWYAGEEVNEEFIQGYFYLDFQE